MRSQKISVCMATYNGSKYLHEQLASIIRQLSNNDEIIVVDDSSTDSTFEILNSFKDQRIKIYTNQSNVGVNKSFEKAVLLSKNEFIFMADQDDIWSDNRVDKMLSVLTKSDVNLVSGNSLFIDSDGKEINFYTKLLRENESTKMIRNLTKIFLGTSAYFGCCMAFKRELISTILPFPNNIESHDLWIAKASILQGKNFHLEEVVLFRRIHGNNSSIIRRSLLKKVWSRVIFFVSIISLLLRNNKKLH